MKRWGVRLAQSAALLACTSGVALADTAQDVAAFLGRFDADLDGAVDEAELDPGRRGYRVLPLFDADGNGRIEGVELEKAARSWREVVDFSEQYDLDRNQIIGPAEAALDPLLARAFAGFDYDHNGLLEDGEIVLIARALVDYQTFLDRFDADQDLVITPAEVVAAGMDQPVLDYFDQNGDGSIRGNEVFAASREWAKVEEFLDCFDANDDGVIEFGELATRGARRAFGDADLNADGVVRGYELAKAAVGWWEDKQLGDSLASLDSFDDGPDPATGLWFKKAAIYNLNTRGEALLIVKDGRIVFEHYGNGYMSCEPHGLASGTKSFNGVMAACAAEDGLLDWDERVSDTITEWQGVRWKSRITVRHLLTLSSGLQADSDLYDSAPDRFALAITMPALRRPGARFDYGGTDYYVFGELMKRKLAAQGETIQEYLERRIAGPIGMTIGRFGTDDAGNPNLPGGARLTAREWIKFGEMVRLGGMWRSQRIVDEDLLNECFEESDANPRYGMTWWLDRGTDSTGDAGGGGYDASRRYSWMPADMVAAKGKGTQRLFVVRSLGLVVVRFANDPEKHFDDTEFFARLLYGVRASRVPSQP